MLTYADVCKADTFEDLRLLNVSSSAHASSSLARTMRGRERKMPKHMREDEERLAAMPWQALIPGRKCKDTGSGVAAAGKSAREGRGSSGKAETEEGEEEEDKEDKEELKRGSSSTSAALSIKNRTTIMTDLPPGWSGRAVTRQSSSQADIWMMAPDGSKLRSVIDVDNWHAMHNKILSRHDRKVFEDSCRNVRRKAAKLHADMLTATGKQDLKLLVYAALRP